MPFIFIHGVNTRENDDYRKNRAMCDELFQRLVLEPLLLKVKYNSTVLRIRSADQSPSLGIHGCKIIPTGARNCPCGRKGQWTGTSSCALLPMIHAHGIKRVAWFSCKSHCCLRATGHKDSRPLLHVSG